MRVDYDTEEIFFFDETEKEYFNRIFKGIKARSGFKTKPNWFIVHNFTVHGSTYSAKFCKALGVDPNNTKWE